MSVFIDGDRLERFDYDVEIRFPRDGVPAGVSLQIDDYGWACESVRTVGARKACRARQGPPRPKRRRDPSPPQNATRRRQECRYARLSPATTIRVALLLRETRKSTRCPALM